MANHLNMSFWEPFSFKPPQDAMTLYLLLIRENANRLPLDTFLRLVTATIMKKDGNGCYVWRTAFHYTSTLSPARTFFSCSSFCFLSCGGGDLKVWLFSSTYGQILGHYIIVTATWA